MNIFQKNKADKLSKYVFACLVSFVVNLTVVTSVYSAEQAIDEIIKDKNLAKCIAKSAANKPEVNWRELKKVKCHGKNIKQLHGLTALSQLEHLSLFNNQLKEADISTFKHLTFVNISNNQLAHIKLTGLSELTTLYLFKNRLTSINFLGLTKLKKMRITNNLLVDINIDPLVSLEKAYFFDNKLEELQLDGLPKLGFVELRQNPMPDEVYDRYDKMEGITIIHDGNADDWK